MTTHSSIRRGPAAGAKRPRLSRRIAALFLSGVALGAGSLAVPSLAQAAGVETLYVSAAVKKNPSCAAASKTAPFATIAGALGCALSGDAISVGRGKFAGAFTVGANVSITGAGSATVIDDPGAAYGGRLISVAPDAVVHLQGLALNGEHHAAGILESSGVLTLDDVSVEGAYSEYPAGGAALDVEPGSGSSAVSVLDSTFANDQSTGSGGAIDVEAPLINGQPVSTLQIADSTFSGDIAGIGGGALHSLNAGVGLFNTTIAGNTDPAVDVQHAPLTLGNTLIAANGASGDGYPECEAQAVDDDGHNLLGRPGIEGCASVTNGANGDQVGTDAAPINPLLGALAKNGGQTPTRALLAGSPAISGGSAAICLASPVSGLDQRGKSRNPGSRGACDIGAYDTGGA